jgi:hypothetical protein
MWPSAKWDLKWQHALVSVAAGAAIGLVCAHVLEHCGWDGTVHISISLPSASLLESRRSWRERLHLL